MNKLFTILASALLCTTSLLGQVENDSILYSDESVEITTTEVEDIYAPRTDSLPYLEERSTYNGIHKFDKDFKKQYKNNSDFDYTDERNKDSLWKRFKRWLTRKIDEFFDQFNVDYETNSRLDTLFRIGGVIVIILLIYYIVRAFIQKDAYWLFKRAAKGIKITVDEVELNLESTDFPALLDKTILEKQYRLSVRYYYLWLLQRLQELDQIQWHIEKTNADYQNEIANEAIKEDFIYLSYLYNNIWYGEFDLDESSFNQAKKSFDTVIKTKLK